MRKVRLYPEANLHKVWKSWVAGCRFVYNKAIEVLKSGFDNGSYALEAAVLNSDTLPDWVKSVPRHPKANAVQDAWDAFKQARANKGEAKFRSCRLPTQSVKFKNGNYLHGRWFPQLTKGLNFRSVLPLPDNCSYGTQLVIDRKRWFAIIPEYIQTKASEKTGVIALDPGVRTFLTGYDGETVLEIARGDIGRVVRLCLHLDDLLSRSTKVKASLRRRMCQAADRIRIKVRNLVDEVHRQTASYLVRSYKVIFLPTFGTSEMVLRKSRKINKKSVRQMLTWSHYRFKQLLKSLGERAGVLVVETNEAYTSKTCGDCGTVHQKLGGSKHFRCPNPDCNYEADRDWNGAFNNMLKALAGTPIVLTDDAIVVFPDVAVMQ